MALTACPECEREVSDQAQACPGCGHPLAAKSAPQEASRAPSRGRRLSFSAIMLILLPAVGLVSMLFWVSGLPLIVAIDAWETTTALVVIGSAVFMAIDAYQIGMGDDGTDGPVSWFLGGIMLYLFAVPLYLHKRAKKLRYKPSLAAATFLLIVAASVVSGAIYFALDSKRQEVMRSMES